VNHTVCDVDTSNGIKKVSYTRNPVKKKNEYEETKRSKNEQCNKRVKRQQVILNLATMYE
jgi:hypothetical protein